ncbi:MAG: outer membrane protein assembly factor BamD [Halopseudomonas sp.]
MVSIKFAPLVVLLCLLGACAPVKPQPAEANAPLLYQTAMEAFDRADFASAIKQLELLDTDTSPDHQAEIVRLRLVLANYELGRHENTITAANNFIRLSPQYSQLDQILYLRGDSYYEISQPPGEVGGKKTLQNTAVAQHGYRDFSTLLTRFPHSQHAPKARLKSERLRQQLADYELTVAEQHLNQGAYVSAANRARYVLENYDATPAVPAALKVIAKAYDALGLKMPAANTRAVLESNFPFAQPTATVVPAAVQPGLLNPPPQPEVPDPSETETGRREPPAPAKSTVTPLEPLLEAPAASKQGWVLQIASFKNPANANKLENRLRDAGYSASVLARGPYYRVIVGSEPQRASIDRLLLQLQKEFRLKGIVKPTSAVR